MQRPVDGDEMGLDPLKALREGNGLMETRVDDLKTVGGDGPA